MQYLEKELQALELKIAEVRHLFQEAAMADEALQELAKLESQKQQVIKAMRQSLSSDSEPGFSAVILEIRPGVGGDEAKIWAQDLLRMYTRFAQSNAWPIEQLDNGIIKIKNKAAFSKLKFETGVHRVQRVPQTEASGRIHTSTASVVALPEVPETAVEIKEDDLLWEFIRGGGHGGQNVNKVATAVRLTHKPTGLIVKCSQERYQEQNRKIALELLRSQLWEIQDESKRAGEQESRKSIGRSMRAEKIRTYNYPQNRITDHRINKSWHKLDRIIDGELEGVIDVLFRQ